MALVHTVRYRQRRLPHWEVREASYFITVRCADSLPAQRIQYLRDLQGELSRCIPSAPQLIDLQRKIFRTLEKYLDEGFGACLLRQPMIAAIVAEEFDALTDWQISVPHYSIMPNHWHALLVPMEGTIRPLSEIMKRLKGRMAKRIRQAIGGKGPFWQSEWFDRWVRDAKEWDRLVTYIQGNPVKAGLVAVSDRHPRTK